MMWANAACHIVEWMKLYWFGWFKDWTRDKIKLSRIVERWNSFFLFFAKESKDRVNKSHHSHCPLASLGLSRPAHCPKILPLPSAAATKPVLSSHPTMRALLRRLGCQLLRVIAPSAPPPPCLSRGEQLCLVFMVGCVSLIWVRFLACLLNLIR